MKDSVRAVWNLMAGARRQYGMAIGFLVLASCLLYLVPLVSQVVLDGVLSEQPSESKIVQLGLKLFGGTAVLKPNLWLAVVAIAGITVLAGLFTYLKSRYAALASEEITQRLRDRVYHHIQHLPCGFFDTRETGDLLQRCTSDVETLRTFLSVQVVEIGRALIMTLIPLPLMLLISPIMTLVSTALIIPIVAFSSVYFIKVRKYFQEKDEAEGTLTARIQENLTGIRVVKAFHRQSFEEQRFEKCNTTHRNLDYRLYLLGARFWSLSDFCCFIQQTLVLVAGAWLLSRGALEVGAFFFFISAVGMFLWPMRMLGRLLSELGKSMVAINRIREVLDSPLETQPENADDNSEQFKGRIEFNQIYFSHGEESPVLNGINFLIEPGTTVAILGASGSGKSTLVNLLLRFYDADQGEILLDGVDITTFERKNIRAQIAVVMQEPFLYSRSLRDNISIARIDPSEESIIDASSLASLHDSIQLFEKGYDTIVGERGITLSGGQRQRVAIARALMQQPAILILDDALSAVDTKTESAILNALKQRHGNHTTILIAHRLSTLMQADKIIVLDHGKVSQQGTHKELKDQKGIYQRIWNIQNNLEVAS